MQTVPTVLLRHIVRGSLHYDWLLGDPLRPGGPLMTYRVGVPVSHWQAEGALIVEELSPHRRHYLRFQGYIPPSAPGQHSKPGRIDLIDLCRGHRGRVLRIGQGTATIRRARRYDLQFDLSMSNVELAVALRRMQGRRWRLCAAPLQPAECHI